ncbi:MAG: hypothetical protein HOE14_19855, partial [Gemmatimonadales bacterium]|nr:hypothetical protein [Gemmatimonadales bacterium]
MRNDTIARHLTVLAVLLIAISLGSSDGNAQTLSDEAREGPFDRLAILNAMIIPGHGGPAYGPADIIVEGGTIHQIVSHNGVTGRPADAGDYGAQRVIDATGMYVMPGLIDLHA